MTGTTPESPEKSAGTNNQAEITKKTEEGLKVAGEKQAKDLIKKVEKFDKENPPGKLHEKYLKKIEESKESKEKSRKKLKDTSIEDIRYSDRLLVDKDDKESNEDRIKNLKIETQKRINAYTSHFDGKWYTIDYLAVDDEHEDKIGLGDILRDKDIARIAVQRPDGEIVIAHRGIVPSGRQAGRVGFLDDNNNYVTTFTGDKFRILSDNEVNLKDTTAVTTYTKELDAEDTQRKEHKKTYEAQLKQDAMEEALGAQRVEISEENVVDQITENLGPTQKANARIIEEEFKEAGLSNSIIAAAIINAHSESRLRNVQSNCYDKRTGEREESFGLFQVNIKARKYRVTGKEMLDPRKNCKEILKEVLGKEGGRLRGAAKKGASVDQLAGMFCYDIERPGRKEAGSRERARKAGRFFSKGIITDVA